MTMTSELDPQRPAPCRILRCSADREGGGPLCLAHWHAAPEELRTAYLDARRAARAAHGRERMPAVKNLWKAEDDLVHGVQYVRDFLKGGGR